MTRRRTRQTREERDKADRVTRENIRVLAALDQDRIGAGLCRHCAGPVPCWSEFGDHAPGVRHTRETFRRRTR